MSAKFQQETHSQIPFAQAKVLVVGDVLDRYWFGDVSRISPGPRAGGENRTDRQRAGGAANIARNIASLGGRAGLLSVAKTAANRRRSMR